MPEYNSETAIDDIAVIIASLVAGEWETQPDAGDTALATRLVRRIERRVNGNEQISIIGATGSYENLIKCIRFVDDDIPVRRARRMALNLPRTFTLPDYLELDEVEAILTANLIDYAVL